MIFLLLSLPATLYLLQNKSNSGGYTAMTTSCISCHSPIPHAGDTHSVNRISCISCHSGNPDSFDKEQAHRGLITIPGNYSNAEHTCGKCHPEIIKRTRNSLMNTMSGIISVDKYVFGENDNLDSLFDINHLGNKTAAEQHLRDKCASCHTGGEKTTTGPITPLSRGGGCLACHLQYDPENPSRSYLSSEVDDGKCFGCHSRSGRISTNYEGWHEIPRNEYHSYNDSVTRKLADGRLFRKMPEDVHHKAGLSCIDCHGSYDVMGDGNKYAHQEQAVHITCEDCHEQTNRTTGSFSHLSPDSQRLLLYKSWDTTAAFLRNISGDSYLYNLIKRDSIFILLSKTSKKEHAVPEISPSCRTPVHRKLSCPACHTAWAPQCIDCHTTLQPDTRGYDLLDKRVTRGYWKEKGGRYLARPPVLGMELTGKDTLYRTFVPGMILHLQKDSLSGKRLHRYFAPTSPHTIARNSRSCEDCHLNPATLGYGAGELEFQHGKWHFQPEFELLSDSLPADAWTSPENKSGGKTTRNNMSALPGRVRTKLLSSGRCLSCHKKNRFRQAMLQRFDSLIKYQKPQCKNNKPENTYEHK